MTDLLANLGFCALFCALVFVGLGLDARRRNRERMAFDRAAGSPDKGQHG
jgi:hypothetical protein